MPFQKQVNIQPAPGVEGDFASTNPFHSLLAGEGALKAGENGVYVARFAWVDETTGTATHTLIAGAPLGFVRRDEQSVITEYLGEATLFVPTGFGVSLYDGGDFWARFADGANVGDLVYASNTDGTVSAVAATASAPEGYTLTGFKVASKASANEIAKITKF